MILILVGQLRTLRVEFGLGYINVKFQMSCHIMSWHINVKCQMSNAKSVDLLRSQ